MNVLIVDDMELNREIIQDILEEEGFGTLLASDGMQAISVLEERWSSVHVILLDLSMPSMSGIDVIRELKGLSWFPDIPIIIMIGDNEQQEKLKALEMGAYDFVRKPFVPKLIVQRVKNAGNLFLHKASLESLVRQQTAILSEQAARLQKNNEKIIDILGTVVEYRNLESGEHIFRIKEYTRIMAEAMMELFPERGLTQEEANLIAISSPLHDIGKITIPDHIMLKPGKLTPEEYELMKAHTTNGAKLLQHIKGAWDEDYARVCHEICLYHHERFDGNGYPSGLKGEEIPISAQLVSIADVYDALVNRRVYKEAYPLDRAYEMIVSGQCGIFSPSLLKCFRHSRRQFEELLQKDPSSSQIPHT